MPNVSWSLDRGIVFVNFCKKIATLSYYKVIMIMIMHNGWTPLHVLIDLSGK